MGLIVLVAAQAELVEPEHRGRLALFGRNVEHLEAKLDVLQGAPPP
jgi:hypothetical protein